MSHIKSTFSFLDFRTPTEGRKNQLIFRGKGIETAALFSLSSRSLSLRLSPFLAFSLFLSVFFSLCHAHLSRKRLYLTLSTDTIVNAQIEYASLMMSIYHFTTFARFTRKTSWKLFHSHFSTFILTLNWELNEWLRKYVSIGTS